MRVHDLKHTFGRGLRAAGVSFEDRQDLLGHKSARITTHYSGPELANLIGAAEKRTKNSRKFPQKSVYGAGWDESGMSKMLILFVVLSGT